LNQRNVEHRRRIELAVGERGVRADLKRGVRILKRDHTVCRDVDHALETACECVRPMPLVATDGRL